MRNLNTINEEFHQILQEKQKMDVHSKKLKVAKETESELHVELSTLHSVLQKEEQDVQKLISISLQNLIHTLMNDEKLVLQKEEKTVLETKLKLDKIHYNLFQIQKQTGVYEELCSKKDKINDNYNRLLKEKEVSIKKQFPNEWLEITSKEDILVENKQQIIEINEAISVGRDALSTVESVNNSLQSAKKSGVYDIVGGGLLTTLAKREHINEAQEKIYEFQKIMVDFSRELNDVAEDITFEIQVDGFLDFADYFFDGILADWAVQEKINNASNQMITLDTRLRSLIDRLNSQVDELNMENIRLSGDIKSMILDLA